MPKKKSKKKEKTVGAAEEEEDDDYPELDIRPERWVNLRVAVLLLPPDAHFLPLVLFPITSSHGLARHLLHAPRHEDYMLMSTDPCTVVRFVFHAFPNCKFERNSLTASCNSN